MTSEIVAHFTVVGGTSIEARLDTTGLSPEEIAYKLERDIGYVDSLCWECSTKINDPEISELSGFEVDGVEYVKDKDGLWVEDRPYTRAPLKEDDNA